MSAPREPVLTLEAFLKTPESYWEGMRQRWATPSGATLENGEDVLPARELGPLTPEDRDALLQWRTTALRAVEGTPRARADMFYVATTLPRVEGGRGLFWLSYSTALAWHYIQESGATLESVASWTWGEWDMGGEFIVRPSGTKPLARADGTATIQWEE